MKYWIIKCIKQVSHWKLCSVMRLVHPKPWPSHKQSIGSRKLCIIENGRIYMNLGSTVNIIIEYT